MSFVVTLYNKENYIRDTAFSLIRQEGQFEREYIFIDDNSTDESVAVLEEVIADIPEATIIKNSDNQGPSVRLNQAAASATGNFLFFFDSDDLLLPGAISLMLNILKSSGADFVHGKHTTDPQATLSVQPDFQLVEEPCRYALTMRPLILVSSLVKTDVFRRAGGCDETVFIQDLSLNLNLACASKRMIDLRTPIMIRLEPEDNLTKVGGYLQAHHDGFFTFRNFARKTDHSKSSRRLSTLANRRAISYGWKHVRGTPGIARKFYFGFLYLASRANWPPLTERLAAFFEDLFQDMQGIRKSTPPRMRLR